MRCSSSVPRLRRRRSSSSKEGGIKKMRTRVRHLIANLSRPLHVDLEDHVAPRAARSSTNSARRPGPMPHDSAHSSNSPALDHLVETASSTNV